MKPFDIQAKQRSLFLLFCVGASLWAEVRVLPPRLLPVEVALLV